MSTIKFSRLIPVFALGTFLAGCQGAERPLAPSLGGPQFSASAGNGFSGKITFHSNRDGDYEIFVMNADGTAQTQLTHNFSDEFDPTWSSDGRQIGFTSFADGDGEIFVMNADGSGITQLTDNVFQDFGPIWSPDGKKIAFISNRDGDTEIFVMNTDGTGVTQLTHNGVINIATAWSPDGKQILFSSYRDGDSEIFVMNADGTGVKQLTDNTASDEGDHAGWSPDGSRIVFSSDRDGGDLDIFVMNADGTGVTQLTHNDFVTDDDPYWSPDGEHIAFQSNRTGDEEIYIMNPDGSGVTQVTNDPFYNDAVPTWVAGSVRTPPPDVQHINDQFQTDYYQFNPCNGELIFFNGTFLVNGTIITTSTGTDTKLHMSTADFQGVGLTTGVKYVYHQQTHLQDSFTYNPITDKFEYSASYDVISQGSTGNFHSDFAYTFTYPPGDFQITRDRSSCTG